MAILFLDDDPTRCKIFRSSNPAAIIVNTAQECIDQLRRPETWREVHLDHDLGGMHYADPSQENTGSEVVRWILMNKPDVRAFIIHSFNQPAALAMRDALRNHGYYALYIPFGRGFNAPPANASKDARNDSDDFHSPANPGPH